LEPAYFGINDKFYNFSRQAVCRETGEWSVDESSAPVCRPIMCDKISPPESGFVSNDGPVAVGQAPIS
jgi:hypothetical protein